MPQSRGKIQIAWDAYLVIFTYIIGQKIYFFFSPDSQQFFYFFFLKTFDPAFYKPYTLTTGQLLLNAIHLIPLACFIYQIRFLSKDFWKVMLIGRVVFDVLGHPYELQHLKAIYHSDPWLAPVVFVSASLIYVPSYIACFLYAFPPKKKTNP